MLYAICLCMDRTVPLSIILSWSLSFRESLRSTRTFPDYSYGGWPLTGASALVILYLWIALEELTCTKHCPTVDSLESIRARKKEKKRKEKKRKEKKRLQHEGRAGGWVRICGLRPIAPDKGLSNSANRFFGKRAPLLVVFCPSCMRSLCLYKAGKPIKVSGHTSEIDTSL